jgi:SAM-dependent methyltransferase
MNGLKCAAVPDYQTVTETPGIRITREAESMAYTRYAFAARFCKGKSVLEAGCGVGQGLGYLARYESWVAGGDYSESLIKIAHDHYRGRVALARFDAHALPFASHSFDVVILYEAIYYLAKPGRFVGESNRVLRDGGVLVVCTVNPEWVDFNPSPMSTQYLCARELSRLLDEHGFDCSLYGAFPVDTSSLRARLVSGLKRAAVGFDLMPRTMRGKELLKRMFLGPLVPAPAEICHGMTEYVEPSPLAVGTCATDFKVIFAVGRRA